MSTQELIELSLLDAMALLDEHEREAFDAAFRAASPQVQAQVRREQTRLARIEVLLPDVTAPAGLRAAVIEAVRRAMAEPESIPMPAMPSDLRPVAYVSRLWRAAAIGLATAATVLAASTLYLETQYRNLSRSIQADTIFAEIARKIGEPVANDVLFDADTQRVVFQSDDAEFKGEAAFFINPEWQGQARFFCKGIATPPGKVYKLAVIDESGQIVDVLADITSSGEFLPKDVPFKYTTQARLAIIAPGVDGKDSKVLSKGELKPVS
jgi:hypothetical protein